MQVTQQEIERLLHAAGSSIDLYDLVPLTVKFQGKPLDIKHRRPMFCPMFQKHRKHKKVVYICGRQIGKTTGIGSSILMDSTWREHFRSAYVAPMSVYVQRMNSIFLMPMIRACMLPWKIQNTTDCVNNVTEKSFLTGSYYFGISAFANAGNALGLSADAIIFDEVQDLNADLIPQIKELIGTSDYRYESYFGTARSVENTLTLLFENSTQELWHMPCEHCRHVNVPNMEGDVLSMIQEQGISCVKCGKLLDVTKGKFVPSYQFDPIKRDAVGYQIPQIIVKDRITPHERYIDTIYNKLHGSSAYSEARFYQEVLGIPTSQGGMPITQDDIANASVLDIPQDAIPPYAKYQRLGGGVDWGGSEITSFTVGTVVGYAGGYFDVLGALRPTGLPDEQRHIVVGNYLKKITGGSIHLCGADAGFVGSVQNPNLSKVLNKPVASIAYGSTKKFFIPGVENRFTVDRTTLIYCVLTLIKQGKIRFPKGQWFVTFTKDILATYTEDVVSSQGTTMRRYARYKDRADDFLHALGYALFVAALGITDIPEMCGMLADTSINAMHVEDIGVEMGNFSGY